MNKFFKFKGAAWLLGAALVGLVAGCGGGTSPQRPVASQPEVVFNTGTEIFRANFDGSNLTFVTRRSAFVEEVAWLPGRQAIIYTEVNPSSRGGGPVSIRRVNRDGTSDREILPDYASGAAISPDGRRIVYTSNQNRDVSVANIDGTNAVRIASGFSPSWSPDSQRIAYASYVTEADGTINGDIYVMNADGSSQKRITTSTQLDFLPEWSPDGNRIVYTSRIKSPINDDDEIYLMNSDGSNQTRLTNRKGFDGNPKWTPDGRRIVYNAASDGVAIQIFIMNTDGSNPARLFNTSQSEGEFDIR